MSDRGAKPVLFAILILTTSTASANARLLTKRQIVYEEDGIRITDLWLYYLFKFLPDFFPGQLMSTPILFLPQVNIF